LDIAYNLDEDEERELMILEGARTDKKRRWFRHLNN
jgi:hypothetical protein